MSVKQPLALIGRLAIQCKMITMEQLQEATRAQGRNPDKRLGEILVEKGFIVEAQVQKLKKLQRDLVVKHRARQAASGISVPARPAPSATPEVAQPVLDDASPSTPGSPSTPSSPAAPPPPTAAQPVAKPEALPPDAAPFVAQGNSLGLGIVDATSSDVDQLHALLREAVTRGASDVHLHAMAPRKLRLNGQLQQDASAPMDAADVERLVSASLTQRQRDELCHVGELDLCYDVAGVGRFRTNIYRQQRGFDAVYRSIPAEPPTLDQLGLPNELAKHTNYHQGMVLVTGPAGCGKSSTMAALVNLINEERDEHILTIEDPIEYVHPSKRCLVNQRHAGRHTSSFARALRGALREDPDVIVIGELRDLETISLAMTAAETGHFVLATLHTSNAVRTISRMIGAFPSNQQGQVRTMLSESLRCVISQRLVVAADGSGRLPALEMLVINKAIGNLIRDEKTIQIRSAIQTGAAHGMYLLEQSLNELVRGGQIEKEEALRIAEDKKLITG